AALAAGIIWGFVPLIFQAVARAGPGEWELLSQRIIWGAAAAAVFVGFAHQWDQVVRAFRDLRTLAWLTLSAVLIAINWVVFIWAVNTGQVIESSLGYYITPLVSMAGGALVFRERLGRIGLAAIALAAVGVVIQGVALGKLPLIALTLAASFGSYGVVRKRVPVDAQSGLLIECLVLAPLALAFIVWQNQAGGAFFFKSPAAAAWLVGSGVITAVPLALFAWGARRMPLSAMGFLQFLSPTISFFIGVAQGEPFTAMRAFSFVFIWAGAAVFVFGAVQAARRARAAIDGG
ncbi:MAG: rarD protein, partial [Caulobacteraceae bacterium]|nr:rarD protein [Caulobacteraceae bacterium]